MQNESENNRNFRKTLVAFIRNKDDDLSHELAIKLKKSFLNLTPVNMWRAFFYYFNRYDLTRNRSSKKSNLELLIITEVDTLEARILEETESIENFNQTEMIKLKTWIVKAFIISLTTIIIAVTLIATLFKDLKVFNIFSIIYKEIVTIIGIVF